MASLTAELGSARFESIIDDIRRSRRRRHRHRRDRNPVVLVAVVAVVVVVVVAQEVHPAPSTRTVPPRRRRRRDDTLLRERRRRPPPPSSNAPPNLDYVTTPTGLQYADVRPGGVENASSSSSSPTNGQIVSIDYVMSTTGARYGSKIYSTVDAGAPYRWTLGDGSTIPGLEEAVRGMRPGGIRRVIIPPGLAYRSTSASISEFFLSPHCRSVFVVRSPFYPGSMLIRRHPSRHVFFLFPQERSARAARAWDRYPRRRGRWGNSRDSRTSTATRIASISPTWSWT